MKLQHSNIQIELAASEANGDHWIMIFPVGTSMGSDGRGPYTLQDMEKVIAASLRPRVDLTIDRDHQMDILPPGTEKPAAGWIKELQARKDGIYARAEWTPRSQKQLADKEYRYISPVFIHDRSGVVKRITRASLVNDPNLEVKAVAAAEARNENKETETMELLKKLAELLGLGEEASEAAVLDAIKALQGVDEAVKEAVEAPPEATAEEVVAKIEEKIETATTAAKKENAKALAAARSGDPDKYVPKEAFDELKVALASMQKSQLDAEVDSLVKEATTSGKLLPSEKQQGWAREYASKDLAGFKDYIAAAPVIVKPGKADASGNAAQTTGQLDDEQKALCASLGLSEKAFIEASK